MSYKPTRFLTANFPASRRTIAVLLTAAFLGVFDLPPAVGAEIISPDVGLQATLDAVNVSIYYHPTSAGYHVVITAGTETCTASFALYPPWRRARTPSCRCRAEWGSHR